MRTTLFPEIELKDGNLSFSLSTTIRKKYRGKWYLYLIATHWSYPLGIKEHDKNHLRKSSLSNFHRDIYLVQTLIKVSHKLTDRFGEKIFKLDTNQSSEEDRLRKTFPHLTPNSKINKK